MLQPSVCQVLFIQSPHLASYVRNLTLHSPVHSITALTVDILQLISCLPLLKSLSLDAQSPHGITRLVSAILQYLQTNTLIHTVSLGSMCLPPDILYLLPGSPITKLTVSGLREGLLDLRLTEITEITFGLEVEDVGAHWNQWMAKTVNRWANILHDLIPCPLGLRKATLHFWWIEDPDVVDAWLLMDTTLATLHIEEVALSGSLVWRDEDVCAAFPELLKKGIIHP